MPLCLQLGTLLSTKHNPVGKHLTQYQPRLFGVECGQQSRDMSGTGNNAKHQALHRFQRRDQEVIKHADQKNDVNIGTLQIIKSCPIVRMHNLDRSQHGNPVPILDQTDTQIQILRIVALIPVPAEYFT